MKIIKVKARKRPSSIPLMTVKHDLGGSQNWGAEVENRRDGDQTIEVRVQNFDPINNFLIGLDHENFEHFQTLIEEDPKSQISLEKDSSSNEPIENGKNSSDFKISPNLTTKTEEKTEEKNDFSSELVKEPPSDEITDETPRDIGPPAPMLELENEPVPVTPDSHQETRFKKISYICLYFADSKIILYSKTSNHRIGNRFC